MNDFRRGGILNIYNSLIIRMIAFFHKTIIEKKVNPKFDN